MTEKQYQDLKMLANSPGWKLMKEYLEKQIAGLQIDLERKTFGDLSEVALIQGKIQAFRAALEYPDTRLKQYEKKQEV